jgi:F0F1-type ATP synthase assembly protein I
MKQVIKIISGFAAGAVVGAAAGYFGKCASGACPLTNDPVTSAFLFGLIGALIATAISARK